MISTIFSILLLVVSALFVYMSSVMVSERKARYRAGTHDYYDNPIEKRCLGGEDEEMETRSATKIATKITSTATGVFDKSKVAYRDGDNT